MIRQMRAAIFDLDGVIVDTAKYHYLAWKRLASEYGFDFTEADNERLKGVSRTRSLEILLEIGGLTFDDTTKAQMAARKNEWYVDYICRMDASEILPGATQYLQSLRARGIKTALGSASRNAPLILERLGISVFFDVIVDGNKVTKAKPDPEVFLRAAEELNIPPASCIVFEDAEAGIEAAHRAGMGAVGIGNTYTHKRADIVIPGLFELVVISAC
ncbi:MAG TPA: beta-phosphoglucomutase [Anaerolineales bacterium]|nr:beta-phosphoglucomutase [Anaerolineales bacterium]